LEGHGLSKTQVLKSSRQMIHAFMDHRMGEFADLLAEDFVWLGDYTSQYVAGKGEFLKTVALEGEQPPVMVVQEEYAVLAHEGKLWVTYGRMVVAGPESGSQVLSARIHFTFVWRQQEGRLFLSHANACHVLEDPREVPSPVPQAMVFDRFKAAGQRQSEKIPVRDTSGAIHFFFPEEILWISVKDKLCTVHINGGTMKTRAPLRQFSHPPFLRVHKSLLVNPDYVKRLGRYQVFLKDGTVLAVGKKYYEMVRESLSGICYNIAK